MIAIDRLQAVAQCVDAGRDFLVAEIGRLSPPNSHYAN